ncbi:MAG: ribonucleoside triphosphate reductase, partial [Clostridia bacterium]|nr:ribonucleoside triphosphate reductase [Clostridia bacterium]
MIRQIKKRDGRIETFDQDKIKNAIWKAAKAVGGTNEAIAEDLADQVVQMVSDRFTDAIPEVEDIQDTVEKVLIENGHAKTAKAYILYREKRRATREINAMIGATIDMFADYLDDKDWGTKENANMLRSVNGLNNYVRESFTKKYWLYKVYPEDVRKA